MQIPGCFPPLCSCKDTEDETLSLSTLSSPCLALAGPEDSQAVPCQFFALAAAALLLLLPTGSTVTVFLSDVTASVAVVLLLLEQCFSTEDPLPPPSITCWQPLSAPISVEIPEGSYDNQLQFLTLTC